MTKTFTAEVANTAKSISITKPTKATYYYGNSLALAGGSITVTYEDNTTRNVTMTTSMIKENGATVNMRPSASDFGTNTTLNKNLTITYEEDGVTGNADYPITIINDVKSISMKTTPKTTYNVNDPIDLTNGEIFVTRAASTTPEAISLSDSRVKVTGFNSSQEKTSQTLTVTFTENGISKTTTYNVNIVDSVKSISIKQEPKTDYKYGDNLSVTNGTIEVVKGSATTTIPMTADMVTGYDKEILGDQELTVSYGGQTVKYHIYVKDYVTGITVNPASISGNYNDTLAKLISDNNITYTVNFAKGGAKTPESLTESMVTNYNPQTINVQNLTVTYQDTYADSYTNGKSFNETLTITLADAVDTITITPPTKTTYKHGETLNLTGGTITITTVSGQNKNVPMTTAMISEGGSSVNMSPTESAFGANTTLNKNLTITYSEGGKTKNIDYPITIINDVRSIIMNQNPKTTYNVNDPIDLTGGSILVTRAVGAPISVDLTDSRVAVTGFNSTVAKTGQTLTVTFTENGIAKTTTYTVDITDSVKSIAIATPPKTAYKYNEELQVAGGTINVTKGSGTTSIPITADMVTGYNKTTLGDQTLTVTYGGKTTTYVVNVKDYVTGITLNPASITGNYNDSLSKLLSENTINYTVNYAKAGDKPPKVITESMIVAGYNPQTIAPQHLTVTYSDIDTDSFTNGTPFNATLTVTLSDAIKDIVITKPSKETYNHGDPLVVAGGTITVTSQSGATKNVTMTTAMVTENGNTVNMSPDASEYSSDNTLTKNLTITYSEGGNTESINYPITIINDVRSIIMNQNPKTDYNVNDPLDLTGGSIIVTRGTSTPEPVALNDSRVKVTGFSSNTEKTGLVLTVTFTENGISKTTTYNVNVTDSVKSIAIDQPPKKKYKYNDELDVTGGTITVVKGSATTTIPITSSMVTGYDKTELGDQILTVTYGGKTDQYTVNVKDYVTGITLNPSTVKGKYNDTLAKLITDNSITYTVNYAKAGAKSPKTLTESMVAGFSSTNVETQNLTVTYQDTDANSFTNGENKTATLNITLEDAVTGIAIKDNPNLDYGYGETFDPKGGSITVTRSSGATEEKTLEDEGITITELDGTPLDLGDVILNANHQGTKDIQINYEGKKAILTLNITNKITKIEMVKVPKQSYFIGDSLDLTTDGTEVGTIKVTRQMGDSDIIPLDDENVKVTGFNSTEENTNLPIKVSYTENGIKQETSYEVSIIDNVGSAELGTTPKTTYKYGEPLDVSTGTIKVTRGGQEEFIPMKESMVTEADGTPFNPNQLGTRELTVTYGGQEMHYTVTVNDYVQGIVLKAPTKLKYEYGESLKLDGGTVQKVMASGAATTPVALDDNSVTISTFNPTKIGAQTIDVTYQGFTEHFGVVVEDNVQSISLEGSVKVKYKYGESLDIAGGSLLVTRSSGTSDHVPLTSSMVTGFNPNQLGPKTLTITYEGKTTTYNITVDDYVTDIDITRPDKLTYKIGEAMDLSGGLVKLTMASGAATTPVAMTDNGVTIGGFDTASEGVKTIRVTYQGFTKTFSITVADALSGMIIHTLPDKLDYRYGESLNLSGGTIELQKESGGTPQIISMTTSMVTGYNPNKVGTQTLTVTYEGFTQEFTVNVEDYVSKLNIQTPTKVNYEYGESLDLNGGKVSIIMASGKTEETVNMTASMLSGYNAKQEGTQKIIVEYKGLQGSFNVKVTDSIKGISIAKEPSKTTYQYGENIDLTNGTINVVKTSGITTIPITYDMISGYNANSPGTQLITVSYGGFTTKFAVRVNEQVKTTTPTKVQTTRPVVQTRNVYVPVETPAEEPVQEPEEIPVDITPIIIEMPEKEKPTKTLGVKDEKQDTPIDGRMIAGGIAGLGIFALLALAVLKRNVKVFVEEDGEFALAGLDKLNKKKLELNINKYLDGDTYENRVKVQLTKAIAKKLDGKEIEIRHRDKLQRYKINYDGKEIEINLN